MRRMREDSGRFWMILLAGLALMGGMLPTQMALAQDFELTVTVPEQQATVSRSTGEMTLTVNVTCNQDGTIDFVECFAEQFFGRTGAAADGETEGPTSYAAGEITPIMLVLGSVFGAFKRWSNTSSLWRIRIQPYSPLVMTLMRREAVSIETNAIRNQSMRC